jgi:hypothetical protein
MSVSAHLSPEPERRLWLILGSLKEAADRADWKVAALTAFSAAQLALLPGADWLVSSALGAAIPLGVFAFSPLARAPRWLRFAEPARGRAKVEDSFLNPEDLVKYTHGDLIFRLDKYLGGGITATPYYEDLVGQITESAVVAARKKRLLRGLWLLVSVAQFDLLFRLAGR